MKLPIILRTETKQDLIEAEAWYEQQRIGLGAKFVAHLTKQLDRIADTPEMYAAEWQDVRLCVPYTDSRMSSITAS